VLSAVGETIKVALLDRRAGHTGTALSQAIVLTVPVTEGMALLRAVNGVATAGARSWTCVDALSELCCVAARTAAMG